jgi:hypothetical protein
LAGLLFLLPLLLLLLLLLQLLVLLLHRAPHTHYCSPWELLLQAAADCYRGHL